MRLPQVVSSYKLAPKSLLFLKKDNWLRKPLIRLVKWKPFDWFMLTVILANCISLAMQSNAPGFQASPMGQSLRLADIVFISLFTWEAVCKIIALGFLFDRYTYLRSGEHPCGATWEEDACEEGSCRLGGSPSSSMHVVGGIMCTSASQSSNWVLI